MSEFKSLNQEGYFKCFSPNLYRYLKQNNFYYITKNIHEISGRTYWEFEKTDKLDRALKQFTKEKAEFFNSRK